MQLYARFLQQHDREHRPHLQGNFVGLLQEGYRVRGSLRSLERADSMKEIISAHIDPQDRLEFVALDLMKDENIMIMTL